MKIKTILGKDVALPFLGWTKVRNFERITDEERNEVKRYLQEIGEIIRERQNDSVKATRIEGAIKKLRILAEFSNDSNDLCLRALGSQIKMTASMPEVVRSSLTANAKKYMIETIDRMGVETLDENDYLRGFYLNALLFNRLLESAPNAPEIQVNRIELAKEIIDAGKILKNDFKSLHQIYVIFDKYCNKRMVGIEAMPEISFLINYMHRILIEVLYESGAFIGTEKYKNFCKFFGEKCFQMGKGLLDQDRMVIASTILELYEYTEKITRDIYGS